MSGSDVLFLFLFGVVVGGIFGGVFCAEMARRDMQAEAIRAGVAERYIPNPLSRDTEFRFITNRVEVVK